MMSAVTPPHIPSSGQHHLYSYFHPYRKRNVHSFAILSHHHSYWGIETWIPKPFGVCAFKCYTRLCPVLVPPSSGTKERLKMLGWHHETTKRKYTGENISQAPAYHSQGKYCQDKVLLATDTEFSSHMSQLSLAAFDWPPVCFEPVKERRGELPDLGSFHLPSPRLQPTHRNQSLPPFAFESLPC